MKIATQGRWLWLRTIGSTLVGQGLDSAVFISLAFAGTIPVQALTQAIVTQWLVKSAYEAAATPMTYVTVHFLKRKEEQTFMTTIPRLIPSSYGGNYETPIRGFGGKQRVLVPCKTS